MPEQTVTEKASTDITAITFVTAIGGVLAAFAIFQPKLAIPAAMKRETGSVEPAFSVIYSAPQYLNVTIIGLLCVLLLAAFAHSIRPDWFANGQHLAEFGAFFVVKNVVWILLLAAVVGFFVQINLLSWILLAATTVGSFLPIPLLRSAFGRNGKSAGWHQAWNVCRAWDKGQPLLLNRGDIERIADTILYRLTDPASGAKNFAPTPVNAALDARANIALFGCILEAKHYAHRWSSPSWAEFYAALATIHDRTNMFSPSELQKFKTGEEFATQLRNALAAEIDLRSEPWPQDKYLAAADDLSSTWDVLGLHSGNVLNLIPFWAPLIGGRLYWLDRRLSRLPMLNSLGMRPQLIKLLARWKTLPWAKTEVFVQPFAKRQGWLLLQENALRVFPAQNDVTFFDVGDVQLTRIACLRIFRSVENRVRGRHSQEAKTVDAMYPTRWELFAKADFSLWDWADEAIVKGRGENWDATKGWRWRFQDGRAIKIS